MRSQSMGFSGLGTTPHWAFFSAVLALRTRQMKNLATLLMLSRGVPMITAGDEVGRSQQGNNNAYCQDNEIAWLDWNHANDGAFAVFMRGVKPDDTEKIAMVQEVGAKSGAAAAKLAAMLAASD